MSSDPHKDIDTTLRSDNGSLLIKLGKAVLEAKGHGVYVLPIVLGILGTFGLLAVVTIYVFSS